MKTHACLGLLFAGVVLGLTENAPAVQDVAVEATQPTTQPADASISDLIIDLGADDPAARDRARAGLLRHGQAARQPLSAASDSPDPAIARAAKQLLVDLPWHEPGDPPAVKQLLNRYAVPQPEARAAVIEELAKLRTPQVGQVLLRLLMQEPSEMVRWAIVGQLQKPERKDLAVGPTLRGWDTESLDSPAALTAVAWALREIDPARSTAIYRRVWTDELARPVPTLQLSESVLEALLSDALTRRDFAAVAQLRREQAGRAQTANDSALDAMVYQLMAVHAIHGPQPGFDEDLKRFADNLQEPTSLYALARVARHRGDRLTETVMSDLAFNASDGSPERRNLTVTRLMENHWFDAAEREMRGMLKQPIDPQVAIDPAMAAMAADYARGGIHVALGGAIGRQGRDAEAAEHYAAALALFERLGAQPRMGAMGEPEDPMTHATSQMHWRRMRVARQAGDDVEVDRQAERLMQLGTGDADILFDLLPELERMGRKTEAAGLIESAQKPVLARLRREPNSAEALNNTAWLLARTGQDLDDALKHATKAVELEPHNFAYIDTLAEVYFRRGDAAEAVRRETQALELRPDDVFMRKQLERYKKGAGAGTDAPQ